MINGKTKSAQVKPQLALEPRSNISTLPSKNPIDHAHFEFFFCKTVPRLSGPFKSDFWDRSVLQAIHQHDAIKHAVLAISILHQGFHDDYRAANTLKWQDNLLAIKHYLQAIKHLVDSVQSASSDGQLTDVALMACVLFICFEVRQQCEFYQFPIDTMHRFFEAFTVQL